MDGNEENIASIADKNKEAASVFNQTDEDYYFSEIQDYIFSINYPITTERIELFAVIKDDNAHMYSSLNDNRRSGYLHRGNVIRISNRTAERVMVNNVLDYFYSFEVLNQITSNNGWVHGQYLDIINIPTDTNTSLTNALRVNHERFPRKIDEALVRTSSYAIPDFINELNNWVIVDNSLVYESIGRFTIRLHDLPDEYNIYIYAKDMSNPFRFSAKKIEFPFTDYRDNFQEEDWRILNDLIPLYNYSYEMPITMTAGIHRTEIRSRNHELLLSANLNYSETLFRMNKLNEKNYYMQYRFKKPFYLVVYETIDLFTEEEIPVAAFSIYPENEIWEGLFTLGNNLAVNRFYRIYLYHLDESNPNDFSRPIDGYWQNHL